MATGTVILPVLAWVPDGTNPPGLKYTNGVPFLLFDTATDEICRVTFRVPADYASGPLLKTIGSMDTATSGNVAIECALWAQTAGDSVDADTESYDTVNTSGATAVPGTAGYPFACNVTLSNADSMAAGDLLTLKLNRDVGITGDAAGDLELRAVSFEYTTS